MKCSIAMTIPLAFLAAAPAHGQQMEITPNGSRPSTMDPAETFTGSVVVTPLFEATAPARATGGQVTFAPGARSAWHTHPAGQILIVTSGVGWVQERGGERREIRPDDVVWTPPGVQHWHGATAMSHIAIQEAVDGKNVDWLEKVGDEQYPVLDLAFSAPLLEPGRQRTHRQGRFGCAAPGTASRRQAGRGSRSCRHG